MQTYVLIFWVRFGFSSHDQDIIHTDKGCVEMCDFCMAALVFLIGHGIKARTHAPCRNRTFPKEVHHQNPESTGPAASCFPGPDDATLGNVRFLHGHGFLLFSTLLFQYNDEVCTVMKYCETCNERPLNKRSTCDGRPPPHDDFSI